MDKRHTEGEMDRHGQNSVEAESWIYAQINPRGSFFLDARFIKFAD